ncbi:MAG: 50S ribosomal protein L15 [Sedimentisphaerales bacterium]|nr:50S ribosomal protein L15 [Sedimentisphaerales bacterium]HML73886.1 50S ribosomal protein L15 [Anaerohalosphaeraceae bacterium]
MYMHEITAIAGAYKKRKRVGRGKGSGHGKTCGRGHKGDGSRSGFALPLTYEGGQMPLFRRLPKRGFNNANFTTRYEVVNVSQLERLFEDGAAVGVQELYVAGLLDSQASRVKILGDGELTKKLNVSAHKFSKSAEQKISGCGGTIKVVA